MPNGYGEYTFTGPYLHNNRIVGTIPKEILSDTLKLSYTTHMIGYQEKGYGLSNMPTFKELHDIIEEYCEDHPELENFLRKIDPKVAGK